MGKLSHVDSKNERYGYRPHIESEAPKRLDLNDLLKRVENEKNKSRKLNIFIFSGATTVVVVFLTLLSL